MRSLLFPERFGHSGSGEVPASIVVLGASAGGLQALSDPVDDETLRKNYQAMSSPVVRCSKPGCRVERTRCPDPGSARAVVSRCGSSALVPMQFRAAPTSLAGASMYGCDV